MPATASILFCANREKVFSIQARIGSPKPGFGQTSATQIARAIQSFCCSMNAKVIKSLWVEGGLLFNAASHFLIDSSFEGVAARMGLSILVTGGAGYIGSATARLLLQQNHSVTV